MIQKSDWLNLTKARARSWITAGLLAFIASDLGAATFPLRWRWSNPAPHGNNIIGLAYSSALGQAVQVAELGQIYTSDNLNLWLPRDSGVTNHLRAVTFFGNRIVITGESGRMLYADTPDHFLPG